MTVRKIPNIVCNVDKDPKKICQDIDDFITDVNTESANLPTTPEPCCKDVTTDPVLADFDNKIKFIRGKGNVLYRKGDGSVIPFKQGCCKDKAGIPTCADFTSGIQFVTNTNSGVIYKCVGNDVVALDGQHELEQQTEEYMCHVLKDDDPNTTHPLVFSEGRDWLSERFTSILGLTLESKTTTKSLAQYCVAHVPLKGMYAFKWFVNVIISDPDPAAIDKSVILQLYDENSNTVVVDNIKIYNVIDTVVSGVMHLNANAKLVYKVKEIRGTTKPQGSRRCQEYNYFFGVRLIREEV